MKKTLQNIAPVKGALPSDELPEGWAETQLARFATLITKGTTPTTFGFQYQPKGIAFVRVEDLSDGRINRSAITKFINKEADEVLKRSRLHVGDLLFSIAGTIGRTALVAAEDLPANTNQALAIIRGTESVIIPQLLQLVLASAVTQRQAQSDARGGSMNNISLEDVRSVRLTIPPRGEQRRINQRLEELLAIVKRTKKRLAEAPKILKAFRQSVLAAACSGRLTDDWREKQVTSETAETLLARIRESHEKEGRGHGGQAADPTEGVHELTAEGLPPSWAIEELKWLCKPGHPITYGILKPGPDYPNGVPYIRVADFPGNKLNAEGVRRTNPDIANAYRRSSLEAGDVLLSIRGTAGRVCRVPKSLSDSNITQDTARISVHREMSPEYVEFYLKSPGVQKRLESAMKGVAVRGVNIGDVRALQIEIPPLEEQYEIVRRVEALFDLADKIGGRVGAATKLAEKITQAILAKAFRGELVPTEAELARREGRDYEPASVLLEGIKSDRDTNAHGDVVAKSKATALGRK